MDVGLAIIADPPHPLYNYAQPHANIPQRVISFQHKHVRRYIKWQIFLVLVYMFHYYLWTLVRSLFSLAPSL